MSALRCGGEWLQCIVGWQSAESFPAAPVKDSDVSAAESFIMLPRHTAFLLVRGGDDAQSRRRRCSDHD